LAPGEWRLALMTLAPYQCLWGGMAPVVAVIKMASLA
jgi:hypothetical protein